MNHGSWYTAEDIQILSCLEKSKQWFWAKLAQLAKSGYIEMIESLDIYSEGGPRLQRFYALAGTPFVYNFEVWEKITSSKIVLPDPPKVEDVLPMPTSLEE